MCLVLLLKREGGVDIMNKQEHDPSVITSELVLHSYPNSIEKTRSIIRFFDCLIAFIGLLVNICFVWPILFVIMRVKYPGPFFYRQLRLGEHGRGFWMYKIRTMRVDAERTGPQISGPHDTRRTKLGVWLRATRLDETPQFWNVLRGDMSVVGPRPERPERFEYLMDRIVGYDERLKVPQGITGWAQLHCGYGDSEEKEKEKNHYDRKFIDDFSLSRYFVILVITPFVMIRKRGL